MGYKILLRTDFKRILGGRENWWGGRWTGRKQFGQLGSNLLFLVLPPIRNGNTKADKDHYYQKRWYHIPFHPTRV
jgi:hypothetical protein